MKRLYRSEDNKVFFGVLGGVGEYFSVDPTVLRVLFVLATFLTGIFPFVVFYFIAALLIPSE